MPALERDGDCSKLTFDAVQLGLVDPEMYLETSRLSGMKLFSKKANGYKKASS